MANPETVAAITAQDGIAEALLHAAGFISLTCATEKTPLLINAFAVTAVWAEGDTWLQVGENPFSVTESTVEVIAAIAKTRDPLTYLDVAQ
jgi:hypothetical protein